MTVRIQPCQSVDFFQTQLDFDNNSILLKFSFSLIPMVKIRQIGVGEQEQRGNVGITNRYLPFTQEND